MAIACTSLSYQTLEQGSLAGFFAFVLELGGADAPRVSVAEILKEIDTYPGARKHLRIRGDLSQVAVNDSDLIALIGCAANRGMVVSVEQPINSTDHWLEAVSYRIGLADKDSKFTNRFFHEIWYKITGFSVPELNLRRTIPYLDLSGSIGVEKKALMKWLQKSPISWAILMRSPYSVIKEILL